MQTKTDELRVTATRLGTPALVMAVANGIALVWVGVGGAPDFDPVYDIALVFVGAGSFLAPLVAAFAGLSAPSEARNPWHGQRNLAVEAGQLLLAMWVFSLVANLFGGVLLKALSDAPGTTFTMLAVPDVTAIAATAVVGVLTFRIRALLPRY